MEKRTQEVIKNLGDQLLSLDQPIHLLAIITGGKAIAPVMHEYLTNKGIKTKYYEVRVNRINEECFITKSDFNEKNYTGTVVVLDDVIWSGSTIEPVKEMLTNLNPGKKFFIATLLDCNNKGDFSVFK